MNGVIPAKNTNLEQECQTPGERFNATDDARTLGLCLTQLFEHAVESYPNEVAVISGQKALTYGALNSLANRLTRRLTRERGVTRGDVVGVALDRSINFIISLIAIVKAGAVYMPINPALPVGRVEQMIDDAYPKLVITSDDTLAVLSCWKDITLNIDEERGELDSSDDLMNLDLPSLQPEDIAYIIYTSGSTGRPKGAKANHEALCNLLLAMQRDPGCGRGDRLLAVASFSFDISIADLLLPIVSGATLVIAQTDELRDPGALLELMQRHAITMAQATPSFWQMLLDSGWQEEPRLAKIVAAGEPLSRQLADRLLSRADAVWNAYGPSEATIYASMGRVRRHDEEVIIGTPIPNFRLYVLHVEDLSPASLGSIGELYIGGVGVNCGYHNSPELTKSCFLDNPFHQGRLYRTGDLARFIAPGQLCMLGRSDGQVKVRGYRIELGDISTAITNHKSVSSAVVVSHDDHLIAYCLCNDDNNHKRVNVDSSLDSFLRPWLANLLPAYMMPAFFVRVDAFPMTVNGKIDRKALPDPITTVGSRDTKARPQTELEHQVLAIWSDVLGHERIGVTDNFFQIGGNSLRVPRVRAELEKLLRQSVPTAKLFEHYTIKTLAKYLEYRGNDNKTSTENIHHPLGGQEEQRHPLADGNDDIAIISMACRLPGGITNPEEYWEMLEKGHHGITDVPKDRWDSNALFDADPNAPGKSYCRRGGFIVGDIHAFDAPFFGISPKEAAKLDPTQHMVLETCWEGFERAGYTMSHLRGSQTGVFVGQSNISAHNAAQDLADLDGYALTGSSSATISGRVSYIFGLEGPSLTIDTACSSSLVSTHLGCTSLRQGECNMAVVAGITLLSPGLFVEFGRLGGLSFDGHCRAFSADTEGTGLSEGSTAVVLKRLSDAQRDGDKIHAVLRGSAVNHGGRRSAGLTIPSSSAQERLIRTALKTSGLDPSDIDFIEAHGTATKLGDPIEGTALNEVFSDRSLAQEKLWIGSSKSNLGHTQGAAGLAGVIKVALALQHNVLPKTLHISEPTPLVDWEKANMALVLKDQPWNSVKTRRRRAGVSSFGIGGTNAHVIIEEPPIPAPITRHSSNNHFQSPRMLSFLVSAQSDMALRQNIEKLLQHVKGTSSSSENNSLGDLAYSLATTRTHFRQRVVLMADSKTDLIEKLAASSASASSTGVTRSISSFGEPHLAMLFTGQGSQRLGMGKGLSQLYPLFREALGEIASHFTDLEQPLLDVMWADSETEAATLLHRTDYAQPAIFALEVALWRLWESWGIQPQVVLGHSVGEIAAAHVAGILDLSNACRLVAARGYLMHELGRYGSMVSLEIEAVKVKLAISHSGLGGKVEIAGYNTPMQTVISGDSDAVDLLLGNLTCRMTRLNVFHAFHSYHMDEMLPAFEAFTETICFETPNLPIISSLTGRLAEVGQLERPSYWVQQVRRAVRFSDSVQTLYHQQGVHVCIELGPQPVLSGLVASCLTFNQEQNGQLPALLPSLTTGKKDDQSTILATLAELHVRHIPIDWARYFKAFDYQRIQLPTYVFQRQRYSRISPPSTTNSSSSPEKRTDKSNNFDGHGQIPPIDQTEQYQFEIKWSPIDQSAVKFSSNGGSWGLLCPIGGVTWAKEAKRALSRAGIQLIQVQKLQDAAELDGLVCLWDDHSDVKLPDRAFDLTIMALKQLQDAVTRCFSAPILWVTRHAIGIQSYHGDDSILLRSHHSNSHDSKDDKGEGLAAAPLWGLMRTARYEHPELDLRLIDLGLEKDAFEMFAPALMVGADENECAVRNGQMLRPQIQRVDISERASNHRRLPLRQDGALLITGGLGGIGQQIAKWLASVHQIYDLVLCSRSGMNTPGAEVLIGELAQLGATATIVTCDVGDFTSVRSLMETFNQERPLRGVIHAAGLVDNGVLSTLTPERCATTFEPKVNGAWYLHQLTQDMDLDIFMMFSSVSGVLGLPGLGNYTAANTFIDALAHLRRAQNLPATSVAYGLWGGDGMAAKLNGRTTRTHLTHFGLDPLQPEDGLKLFEQAVKSGRPLTVAAALDTNRLRIQLEEDRGSVPSFFRLLLSQKDGDRNSKSEVRKDAQDGRLRKALREADLKQHPSIVLAMVRETVGKALGFASADQVDTNVSLQDIGFDSLTAVLIRNHLANLTQLKTLSTSWNYPNLKSLSNYLLSQLQMDLEKRDTSLGAAVVGKSTNGGTTLNRTSYGPDMTLIRQGYLDQSLKFNNVTVLERPNSVLVTGATGFVGAFILHELLELGVSAHCLVRAREREHGKQRLVASLTSYDLWKPDYAPLLHPVIGNIAEPFLGLREEDFDHLADQVEAICHAGALVDWMRPLDEYIGPNVISTHEVLRLASRGQCKAVHVISTLATLPKHLGFEVSEHDREYGYSSSKYMAERMVSAARWRGAKASVYRVPFVTASVKSGHFRHDRGDFLHNLIAGSIEIGSFPSLDADLSVVLPVDYFGKTIGNAIVNDLLRIGHDYDFVWSPAPSSNDFFKLMGAAIAAEGGGGGGYELQPFALWQRQALAYAIKHPRSSLAHISAIIDGLTDQSASELLKGLPPGQHVFGGDVYPAPMLDQQVIQKYWARIRDFRLAALDTFNDTNVV